MLSKIPKKTTQTVFLLNLGHSVVIFVGFLVMSVRKVFSAVVKTTIKIKVIFPSESIKFVALPRFFPQARARKIDKNQDNMNIIDSFQIAENTVIYHRWRVIFDSNF